MDRLKSQGLLKKPIPKIYIGQGFRGQKKAGIGIGSCTCGFENYVDGCPPKASQIVDWIRENLKK
jgi:hypothetical protein